MDDKLKQFIKEEVYWAFMFNEFNAPIEEIKEICNNFTDKELKEFWKAMPLKAKKFWMKHNDTFKPEIKF